MVVVVEPVAEWSTRRTPRVAQGVVVVVELAPGLRSWAGGAHRAYLSALTRV